MFILSIICLVYLLIGGILTIWTIITGDRDAVDDMFNNNGTIVCILSMIFFTVSYPYFMYSAYKEARDEVRNIKS